MDITARYRNGYLVGVRQPLDLPTYLYDQYRCQGIYHNYRLSEQFFKLYMTGSIRLIKYAPLRLSVEHVSANLDHVNLHIGNYMSGLIGSRLAAIERYKGHNVSQVYYVNDANTIMQRMYEVHRVKGYGYDQLYAHKDQCPGYTGDHEGYQQWRKQYTEYQLQRISAVLANWGLRYDYYVYQSAMHQQILPAQKDGLAEFFTVGNARVYIRDSSGTPLYSYADIVMGKQRFLDHTYDKYYTILGRDQKLYSQRITAITAQLVGVSIPQFHKRICFKLVPLLTRNDAKMSKRTGNILRLSAIAKAYHSAVNYLLLSAIYHYRGGWQSYYRLLTALRGFRYDRYWPGGNHTIDYSVYKSLIAWMESISTIEKLLLVLNSIIDQLLRVLAYSARLLREDWLTIKPTVTKFLSLLQAVVGEAV